MAEFAMEIAGHTGLVRSLFDSTRDYCGRYLSEKKPEFSVTVRREDLEFEQEALRREAEEEGFRFIGLQTPFWTGQRCSGDLRNSCLTGMF